MSRVESLLASGVDANTPFHGNGAAISAQANDAALDGNATQPPQVYSEPTEMPVLRRDIRDLELDSSISLKPRQIFNIIFAAAS